MGNCLKVPPPNDEDTTLRRETLAKSSFAQNSEGRFNSIDPQASVYSNQARPNYASQQGYNSRYTNAPQSSFTDVHAGRSLSPSVTSGFTDTVHSMAKGISDYLPYHNRHQREALVDLVYPPPKGCFLVENAERVDGLDTSRGLERWRCESGRFGLIMAKVLSPDGGGGRGRGSVTGTANDNSSAVVNSKSKTPEQLFENELAMLTLVQCTGRASVPQLSSYRSKSPMKAGYEGEAFEHQHDNVIGLLGYMECKIDLSNARVVDRLLLTEFYIDTLRDHVQHRTQSGKKEMKHYEVSLYAFQMAKGLLTLHRMKVCHRDLNPENVVMGLGLLDKEYKEWLRYVAREETKRTLETYAHLAQNTQSMRSHASQQHGGLMGDNRRQRPEQQQPIHYHKFLQTQPLVAKLANFGESKFIGQYRTKTRVGSIQFMAPEMIKGEDYDLSLDIWSFGSILYEMISGRPPFYKKPGPYIESRVIGGKYPKSDPVGSKAFDNLQYIMRNCLKTQPALRCAAKDLVEDLGRL